MRKLIAAFLYGMLKKIYRFMREPSYREYIYFLLRFGSRARYTPCMTRTKGFLLQIPDAASFLSGYKEIFAENIYFFKTSVTNPRIIDLGANIGLSILYFKSLYPEADICALEADPKIFNYLVRNVHGNGFKDVNLINKAAWNKNTTLHFMSEGADGGRISTETEKGKLIAVEAIEVSKLIGTQSVDLLKIDIEGAEVKVLTGCRNVLSKVQRIFVEYHSNVSECQDLSLLLDVLEKEGFRYHIHSMLESPKPFIERQTISGYDMLLNIFAWKE